MTFLNFTIEDPSPLILYSDGQWVEGSSTNDTFASKYSDGSFKVTFTQGATATLIFVGNSITVYGAKRPNHGDYSVVLDSEPAFTGNGTVDQLFRFPLWNAQNLTYGQHTAILTNIPTSSNRKFLDVDFISIGRDIGPVNYTGQIYNVTIEDESPFFIYNGSWSSIISPTASSSSLHSTIENGASVSFYFQGSSIELYGLYVNAPFRAQIDNQLSRDLAGPNVDLNAQQEHPKTLLYYMDGLDENESHVLRLTNTVANTGRPFYIDYAVVRGSQKFFGDTPSPNPGFIVPGQIPTSTSKSSPSISFSAGGGVNSSASIPQPFPMGAIIGGVVGGICGLIILAFVGLVLFCRWRYMIYHNNNENNRGGRRKNSITTDETQVGQIDSSASTSIRGSDDSSDSSQYSHSEDIFSRRHDLEKEQKESHS